MTDAAKAFLSYYLSEDAGWSWSATTFQLTGFTWISWPQPVPYKRNKHRYGRG